MQNIRSLLDNSRFYFLVFSFLLSVCIVAYFRIQILDNQLYIIRIQQVYGFISILLIYLALIISPLGYVIGKQRMRQLEFLRRAIGVSAFYFALLHSSIAFWGQLGGFSKLGYLPSVFITSLVYATISLAIFAVLAVTSFDKVVSLFTYRWWKWLHRLVYVGLLLIIVHVWAIGTHVGYDFVTYGGFILLSLLGILESIRTVKNLQKSYPQLHRYALLSIFAILSTVIVVAIYKIPNLIENYHTSNTSHSSEGELDYGH